jgi:poly-gamma-glutamate synthesis protein (capsule biosynthesis protein)
MARDELESLPEVFDVEGVHIAHLSYAYGTNGIPVPSDLIIGHHAHVVQPIEQVNGIWVADGIGNILSNLPVNDAWPASSQDAAIVEFEIAVDSVGNVAIGPPTVVPTWVDKDNGWVIRDVNAELARADLDPGRRSQLQASFDRTAGVLGDYLS